MESVKREPVMKLEAERLWGGAGEYAVSFEKAGWLDECRRKGGTFLLYTQPDWADFDRVSAENLALQKRLTVKDQRNAELSAHNQLMRKLLGEAKANLNPTGRLAKAIDAALKPTAEAEPQCLLCPDKKTVPGNIPGGFVKDCPDCCGEEG